jgi:hypothetical protein
VKRQKQVKGQQYYISYINKGKIKVMYDSGQKPSIEGNSNLTRNE